MPKQWKTKYKPRIKLNHNSYSDTCITRRQYAGGFMYAPASTLSFFPYKARPVADMNWMLHDMICNYDF